MLDGSSIRAAREAKGMTQAELAEKIGTSQQTVDKIERGIMKRTTYLPEIYQVLDIAETAKPVSTNGGLTPLMVLRTILCANPTAEQILAALAANGFKIVPENEMSEWVDVETEKDWLDPLAFVNEIMKRRKVSSTELARAAGLAASTLNRWLRNDGSESLTVRTLQKIREWDRSQGEQS
jgi:transcriptional regulator with XRE-family HTH domain